MQTETESLPPLSLEQVAHSTDPLTISNCAGAIANHDTEHELPTYAHASEQRQQEQEQAQRGNAPAPPSPVVAPRARPATTGAQGTANALAVELEAHRYLETTKAKKWLNLFVKSRAGTTTSLPVFYESEVIAGRVELDLDKAEGYKAVTAKIQGGTTFVGQEEEIFLKEEQVLWTPSATETKLRGKHSWPFSFSLPADVSVKDGELGKKGTFRLPPSFSERASPAYINYKIIVTIRRGFLKVNQTLETNFAFIPSIVPELPSVLRRLAYSDGSLLIGPEGDPQGWSVLPPVQIKGTLFNAKDVEVTCTLALATPLCYAVGSPIPLVITFTGEDPHALDVLAEPRAIRLLLRRSIATGLEATDDNSARRTNNHFYKISGMAYFWPSWEATAAPNKRVLQGELELPRDLKPSFKFPNFTIRVRTSALAAFEA
ncbi:hypothetical protein BDN70DRAFT_809665 [Pholiota conissans]|uniref:Arrestin-like N-terminal domain-containing protein n=1 Tax=Pholiota conissans TaxID=109636 RepID=A0A9P5YYJ0_9AGAR|nr:hypothetical protein BDN70DRAFT_809665 [Pholiota conissans]